MNIEYKIRRRLNYQQNILNHIDTLCEDSNEMVRAWNKEFIETLNNEIKILKWILKILDE